MVPLARALVPKVGTSCRVLVPMRQKVVPRANREAIAGFIRPPLQLGLVKPGTDFRHEVLVVIAASSFYASKFYRIQIAQQKCSSFFIRSEINRSSIFARSSSLNGFTRKDLNSRRRRSLSLGRKRGSNNLSASNSVYRVENPRSP